MLDKLPPELLDEVVQHFSTAKDLAGLSLTCRTLHAYVERAGWKILARRQHPFACLPSDFSDWKNAAHGLATFSRNLSRRAFIATYPEPETHIVTLPGREVKTSWERPKGQTMGFQPIIDSYGAFTGSRWRDQTEVVAWGAGAELIIRRQERGRRVLDRWYKASPEQRQRHFDQHRNAREWLTYRHAQHREGYDDITSVNLIRPDQMQQQPAPKGTETVVVGRASGSLAMLQLSSQYGRHVVASFDTAGHPVRSASLMSGPEPLLATSLGDGSVAIFSTQCTDQFQSPLSQVGLDKLTDRSSTRTWSTAFLADQALAVGRGPSKTIISIYGLQSSGLTQSPIRDIISEKPTSTSVYTLAPLPTASANDSTSVDLFLSGAYDGLVRLHDLRSPSSHEMVMTDPIDRGPIFSLVSLGRQRVVAGGGVNSLLKFFDLRMPRVRRLFCAELDEQQQRSGGQEADPFGGWNLFGQPRNMVRNALSSPVYSLSRPSPWSSNIFAGMESSVLQLNFTAAHDSYPDPVFRSQVSLSKKRQINSIKTWDPWQDTVKDLTMYEHNEAGHFILLNQKPISRTQQPDKSRRDGKQMYDDRWKGADSHSTSRDVRTLSFGRSSGHSRRR